MHPPPLEVIVVADGDTDGSWQMAEEFGSRVFRLPTSSGGPARPRNIVALQAKGNYLFFIDADVWVPPDIVSQVAVAFHGNTELTALIESYDDTPAE